MVLSQRCRYVHRTGRSNSSEGDRPPVPRVDDGRRLAYTLRSMPVRSSVGVVSLRELQK